jgi:hypothetical protein
MITSCLHIGIDSGHRGALACLAVSGRNVLSAEIFELPYLKRGLDSRSFTELMGRFDPTELQISLEWNSARPYDSVGSAAEFAMGQGQLEGTLVALSYKVSRVTPQAWKGLFGLPSKISDPRSLAGQAFYKEIFPEYYHPLIYGPRGGCKDGPLDASLIAYYGAIRITSPTGLWGWKKRTFKRMAE